MSRILFGVLQNKPGYNCAITACGKALQGSRVHDLLRQIDDRDLEATVVTLSAAMDAFNRIGNWQETLLLWPRFRGSLRANELLEQKKQHIFVCDAESLKHGRSWMVHWRSVLCDS